MQVQFLGLEDPLEKAQQSTLVFLPGEFHGQRSLAGYSPQGHKELDMTEVTQQQQQDFNLEMKVWDLAELLS